MPKAGKKVPQNKKIKSGVKMLQNANIKNPSKKK